MDHKTEDRSKKLFRFDFFIDCRKIKKKPEYSGRPLTRQPTVQENQFVITVIFS